MEGTPRRLPPPAEVSLLRTAREALTNAAKHAPGAPAELALSFEERCVRLTVTNPAPPSVPATAHTTGWAAPAASAGPGLTVREVEVLRLVARGLPNGEIAAALFIAETTVKTHVNNVFAKIGARNRA
ncbi:LuxR C-terminal-related transcriptional regulator [Nonomuraea pusilla]|uniref:helix-turn-helix transcriptional regulator n=1 Tax=Nonomuraea pusilla TaxID=46177 RepID=UPI00332A7431